MYYRKDAEAAKVAMEENRHQDTQLRVSLDINLDQIND